jgi:hypothetical protein
MTKKPLTFFQGARLFLRENKRWWLIPVVAVLAILVLLIVLGGTSTTPFVYKLF